MIDFRGILPPQADRIRLTGEVKTVGIAAAGFFVGSVLRANTDPGTDLQALVRPAAEQQFTGPELGIFLQSVVIAPVTGERE